jgi:hypothetical protein
MSSREESITAARCPKCEAEVRDGSLFCYNCGGRVSDDKSDERPAEIAPVDKEPTTTPAPGLRSARDIKRRERSFERKPREVVWEPASGFPEMQLIDVTAVIILFTLAVILMALYLH